MSAARCETDCVPCSRCVWSRVQFDSVLCSFLPDSLPIADGVLKPQLLHWSVSPLSLLTLVLYI